MANVVELNEEHIICPNKHCMNLYPIKWTKRDIHGVKCFVPLEFYKLNKMNKTFVFSLHGLALSAIDYVTNNPEKFLNGDEKQEGVKLNIIFNGDEEQKLSCEKLYSKNLPIVFMHYQPAVNMLCLVILTN